MIVPDKDNNHEKIPPFDYSAGISSTVSIIMIIIRKVSVKNITVLYR